MNHLPTSKDKPLFTPGPLTTSRTVKQAMLRDLGSRDREFISLVREIREQLLSVAGVRQTDGYECILLQGSGTFAIESVLTSAVPRGGRWLILINGAYGQRMKKICQVHQIDFDCIEFGEDEPVDPERVDSALSGDAAIDAVAVVHCETTTGIMNPIQEIGSVVRRHGNTLFVDSMSAFGGVSFDFNAAGIDWIVSSANKCIEGVPGFSFCIAKRSALEATRDWSRTLSFDLFAQWQGLENNGQFRFTPPTHAMLAFRQALDELHREGGVAGREARYRSNHEMLVEGMRCLGFTEYLRPELQGPIITSFVYPDHPRFDFDVFYEKLNQRGFVIYPGKVSNANCFRIGNIGRIFQDDIQNLVAAIESVLSEMQVELKPASLASD